jgi:hypothetical protein
MSSPRLLLIQLFCLVVLWGSIRWLFSTPSKSSFKVIDDLLINEKWREPTMELNHLAMTSGRTVMMNSNVTFLGVGRNLGSRLPILLTQIEMLSHMFHYSRAIFVEGGSTDGTLAILRDWAIASNTGNRTLITMPGTDSHEVCGHFKGLKLPREGRLSNARNVGLKELYRQVGEGIKTEYVIVMDLDVLGWDLAGVVDSFTRLVNLSWDVICANGILLHGVYRDTYAFRMNGINTNHHWAGNDEVMYNISKEEKIDYRKNLKVCDESCSF